MTSRTLILSGLLLGLLSPCLAVPSARAAQAAPALTLDQAVEQVQHDTGGKVLSADRRQFGRRTEYRIKVLTPGGHVRTLTIPADASRAAPATSTKYPATRGRGNKEKT